MALSDQHAVTYDFEELQPVIGGVRMDIYITGTAELAHDASYGHSTSSRSRCPARSGT